MKSTAKVIEESNIPPRLVHAVLRQLNGDAKDSLEDIANHGVDGGFHGFIYYSDTIAFFKRNRKDIVALVHSMAEELGESPVEMVALFDCLGGRSVRDAKDSDRDHKRQEVTREWTPNVSRCLYGGRLIDDDIQVANALAWFAAEEVARAFVED